jgi:hypothetical protein
MRFVSVIRHALTEYRRAERTDLDGDVRDVRSREDFKKGYYAFTALAKSPDEKTLFCGSTNFGGDLLQAFDPQTKAFRSMGYASVYEPNEVKIHRGLCVGGDGCVYAATSCLTPIDKLPGAPGGKVFRCDPAAGEVEVLAHPMPGIYIQTISLDWQRRMVYGMGIPPFDFFAYSLEKREVVYRQFMESIAHIGAVDDDGGYWGTWYGRGRRHLLFRYDPAGNKVRFFDHGFPTPCRSLMYDRAGPIDGMVNGGDDRLYVGHESGELYALEYLCKPLPGARLPGIAVGPEGLLLGVGGSDRGTCGFAYDRKSRRVENLGPIAETDGEASCFRTHDCCLIGESLYVGETDNPERSCYLWECRLG